MSHPVWVCGLKPKRPWQKYRKAKSHPVWVCGLKLFGQCQKEVGFGHTLYGCVDWNEICGRWSTEGTGHTLYGWVDWNINHICRKTSNPSHTLYGCVDWNSYVNRLFVVTFSVTPCMGVWIETRRWRQTTWSWRVTPCMGVWIETEWYYLSSSATSRHTLYGCVDWNKLSETEMPKALRHTLYGCVDWNSTSSRWKTKQSRSHPVWVCGLKRHQCCTYCGMECHTLYGCVDWNTRDKPKS